MVKGFVVSCVGGGGGGGEGGMLIDNLKRCQSGVTVPNWGH